ncbi:MAG: TlpA family protein disulfide reductase [Chitinophagaceae bacterium]|jgi:thiol-disulfide isomerase/thioredoxin
MKHLIIALLLFSGMASAQVKTMPDFKFVRMDNGAEYTPKNLTPGKRTFFIFFDTECPHCFRAITEYNKNHQTMNNINIVIVTRDRKDIAIEFLKRVGPSLYAKKNAVAVLDVYNQFIGRFLPKKYPSMFLFGVNRQLIFYSDEEADIPTFIDIFKK